MLLLKTGLYHVQVMFKTGFNVIIKVISLPGLNKSKKLHNQTGETELKSTIPEVLAAVYTGY
jgi:hypothetical protein